MGKHKGTAWGGADAQKSASPSPSPHRGEASDTGNAVLDLRDDVDLLEERMSWMAASSKMPFRFMQSSHSPSEWSLTPDCQQDNPTLEEQTWFCIHVRVMLGEGGGDQPQYSHAWSGFFIVDMFQEGLKEQITEAVVLAPEEAILFFGQWSCKEGLPLWSARDVGFSLMGPISWAGRTAHVEWMGCVEEDVLKGEVRSSNVVNQRPGWKNACSPHTGQGSRWCRRQGRPQFPRDTSGG